MSLTDYAESFGEASAWDDEIWPRFLEYSLKLIAQAFDDFLARAQWTAAWHETQFTAALQFCIFDRRRASRLPIEIHLERQVLDPDRILAGLDDPDSSPRVEIILRHISMPIRTYLACEGKILTTKTIGNRKPKASIDLYVEQGMRRFVDGEYAARVRVGILIGFVLVGPVPTVAARIAETVITRSLPVRVNLTPAVPPACGGHYVSEHPRAGNDAIRLEHLLFELPSPRAGDTDTGQELSG